MVIQFLKQVVCSAAFLVVCSAAFLVVPSVLEAQQVPTTGPPVPAAPQVTAPPSNTGAPPNTDADLRARLERLERQNQELMRTIQTMQADIAAKGTAKPAGAKPPNDQAVKSFVNNYLKEMEATKKQEEATKKQEEDAKEAKQEQEGHRIGSGNKKVTARFEENGMFLWLTTPNEDFTMHPGMWIQWDNVWFGQSKSLLPPPGARPGHAQGVASGVATGGIGPLQDGTFFRRIRPFVEGTAWDVIEYRLELAAENDQFTTEGLDEFWIGVNRIPFLGTVRVGHVKTPMGLEGDMTSSSRCMTFMERSAYSEAIEMNQNFITGIWFNQTYFDDRMTRQFSIFRPDQGASSGAFFGTGQFAWQGRLTGLPLYEEEGRKLLHLGISGGWRNGTDSLPSNPLRVFQLRARPELRDDVPAGSPSGSQIVPNSDSNRLIDTSTISAATQWLMGLELLQVWGPFSVQAEYGWNWIDGAVGIAPALNSAGAVTFNPALMPTQNYAFSGGYVQLAYTLTGENRAYDKKLGTLARNYYGAGGPFTNAWLVRDEDGRLDAGWGAVEIAARYSYVDLNSGIGLNRIAGGRLDGLDLAINWYFNRNMNLMIDWVSNRRSDVSPGTFPGYVNGFGTELQFQF